MNPFAGRSAQAPMCTGAECDFARDHEIAQEPLMREIERRVRGCDYGGTSWATLEQVQQSGSRLLLEPGLCLLDIGAGSGWPALLLATQSGCDVVLTEFALVWAARRASARRPRRTI
jgi:hypothetical protein